MYSTTVLIIGVVLALACGIAAGVFVQLIITKKGQRRRVKEAEKLARRIENDAQREAADLVREAKIKNKDHQYRMKQEFERNTRQTRKELQKQENRLRDSQERLDSKVEAFERNRHQQEQRARELENQEKTISEKENEYRQLISKTKQELESIANLSAEEAKQRLIKTVEDEARHEAGKRVKQIEEEAKETAQRKANWVISTSIQRLANHHVQEKSVSVVQLPSDDMKGRIIGREGRNIRTLEQLTGIDLIVDDTPEAVVISGFNPLRREIAKLALEELIADGRIHPARIEEVVKKAESTLEQKMKELGEQATFDLGLHNMHPELIKLVGKLNYRTSYGQNQYKHAIEVAFIAGMFAAEMGEDIKLAKRAGLLHDIGKVIDHEAEGSHAVVGAEFAKKHGEEESVWHAIGAHHEDYPMETVLDVIVQTADALSGARPGARREALENYTKRIEELEKISTSFNGVEKAFAIQAGREVRIVVENNKVNDEAALLLSKDIAKKIEDEMTYPGQIKITVIRETRAVGVAR